MSMTRKHFVMMAGIIRMGRKGENDTVADNLARSTADMFAKENPRFDREKFLKACGVTE